jgi:hypothetical protein
MRGALTCAFARNGSRERTLADLGDRRSRVQIPPARHQFSFVREKKQTAATRSGSVDAESARDCSEAFMRAALHRARMI